jgi:hypothetical protein
VRSRRWCGFSEPTQRQPTRRCAHGIRAGWCQPTTESIGPPAPRSPNPTKPVESFLDPTYRGCQTRRPRSQRGGISASPGGRSSGSSRAEMAGSLLAPPRGVQPGGKGVSGACPDTVRLRRSIGGPGSVSTRPEFWWRSLRARGRSVVASRGRCTPDTVEAARRAAFARFQGVVEARLEAPGERSRADEERRGIQPPQPRERACRTPPALVSTTPADLGR